MCRPLRAKLRVRSAAAAPVARTAPERASPSANQRNRRNPATAQPGLGVDLLRMNGSGVAASPARILDCIVTPPFRSLQRRREIGRHAVSLEVTEERVRGFKEIFTAETRRRGDIHASGLRSLSLQAHQKWVSRLPPLSHSEQAVSAPPRLRASAVKISLDPSSKGPRGRGLVGRVRAEGPGLDARREMATEGGMVVAD